MKEKKDIFAGIAAGGMSGRKNDLEETFPKDVSSVYFTKTNDNFPVFEDKSYKELKIEYKEGISNLRQYYSKFLKLKTKKNFRPAKFLNEFAFHFSDKNEKLKASIPHYTGPAGRWTAIYSTEFFMEPLNSGYRQFLVFKGVDYKADIYINDNYVGSHEGFFASFEFDITDYIKKINSLKVIVKNDIPTRGNGNMQVNGDKLYAATGPGWDEPLVGWHHCPAGGGIFDKVYIEERYESYIKDIFAKPDIDSGKVHITVSYYSHSDENGEENINFVVEPFNFDGKKYAAEKTFDTGFGINYYNMEIELDDYCMWETNKPFLYNLIVKTKSDSVEHTFGMRKFIMDESNEPKGNLYLNNKPIILRGANEMGHLQLCVMRDDYEQLIEDILIAKYCNMNYYRLTQRPVQEEIYHFLDMLGMMCQTDLPLFGYMRKNQFYEGVKQAGEMERHIRNHPSVIMTTYINEPFDSQKYSLGHRHLSRRELELFFDACDAATYLENPDRVIKRVEGDYDPPTNKGMSDFHCYNMWYTNHALPIGMLYKGYLPALNKGWKTGCGEYGAEGLDNYEVMRKYYPVDWLPEEDDDKWIPDRIIKSQTNTMHGDWYEEQDNIKDWIVASQQHQAFATKLMTLAFRRRSDRIVSIAIHLLIDAWPSGWMKTLLDVDRVPKIAYFAFKDSLEPLKANLRCDRWSGYSDEEIDVEAWILNDKSTDVSGLSMMASMKINNKNIMAWKFGNIDAKACTSFNVGLISAVLPEVETKATIKIETCIIQDSLPISNDSMQINVYPKPQISIRIHSVGKAAEYVVRSAPYMSECDLDEADAVLVSSSKEWAAQYNQLSLIGKIMFLVPEEQKKEYKIMNQNYFFVPIFDPGEVGEDGDIKGLSFAAMSEEMKINFDKNDFSYWYNGEKGFIDHIAEYYINTEPENLYAFGFQKPSFGSLTEGKKKRLPIACSKNGYIFVSFETKGRIGLNPALDKILISLLTDDVV